MCRARRPATRGPKDWPPRRGSSEVQRLHHPHAGEVEDVLQNAFLDMVVDREQQHRLGAGRDAAELEGANIDPGGAQRRSQPAYKAGGVVVDDIDHLAVELGLDLDPEDVDETRLGVAEQRSGYRLLTL